MSKELCIALKHVFVHLYLVRLHIETRRQFMSGCSSTVGYSIGKNIPAVLYAGTEQEQR